MMKERIFDRFRCIVIIIVPDLIIDGRKKYLYVYVNDGKDEESYAERKIILEENCAFYCCLRTFVPQIFNCTNNKNIIKEIYYQES